MSYTPGPWKAIFYPNMYGKNMGAWEVRTESGEGITGWGHVTQTEANAHLIAAAPELLEALRDAFELIDEEYGIGIKNGYWPDITPLHAKIKQAIAKAEGDKNE